MCEMDKHNIPIQHPDTDLFPMYPTQMIALYTVGNKELFHAQSLQDYDYLRITWASQCVFIVQLINVARDVCFRIYVLGFQLHLRNCLTVRSKVVKPMIKYDSDIRKYNSKAKAIRKVISKQISQKKQINEKCIRISIKNICKEYFHKRVRANEKNQVYVGLEKKQDQIKQKGQGSESYTRPELTLRDLLTKINFKPPLQRVTVCMQASRPMFHPPKVNNISWNCLRHEMLRLATFKNYPSATAQYASSLASNGFVYTGNGSRSDDTVTCYFCLRTKNNWARADVIPDVHQDMSPECSMVTGINCNNVPMATGVKFEELQHYLEQYITNGAREDVSIDATEAVNCSGQDTPTSDPVHGPDGDTPALYESDHVTEPPDSHVISPPSATQHFGTASITLPSTSRLSTTTTNPVLPSHGQHSTSNSTLPSPCVPTLPPSETTVTRHQPPPSHHTRHTHATAVSRRNRPPQTPTLSELAIITDRPKRIDFAHKLTRLQSLANWPRGHHLTPEDLASSGFYYGGYGDCARCFYCGGGLKNWEDEDDVWVEHARWFPKCAFIRQQMGQVFVDTVQRLNEDHTLITLQMVSEKLNHSPSSQLAIKENPLKRDPAVLTIVDMGYRLDDVVSFAQRVKEDSNVISTDTILQMMQKSNEGRSHDTKQAVSTFQEKDINNFLEMIRTIKEQNNQLRQQTVCKICMDQEVAVVFLPCGHLVSCADCASAMRDCPLCRSNIKGVARVFLA
ncbi:E3 ubiquitin-protein ligase XIAP-like [Physella acuta]|uniref:E3 ubiquitin-protein ligase XIAP-like n=1 Tax=Physella acuta TaxID=109671 RepID=UPI0027DE0474|nr:E3 ubiquitin-protein ligase XIAP-like [Physella acuta]XP_059150225.1 E3 ubiquitin-protein ligase XIAP-like [Physella acuta]